MEKDIILEDLKEISGKLDLDRTGGLFDASINKSDALSGDKYDKDNVKSAKLCLGFGNLHVKTAQVRTHALRLIGYKNQTEQLKKNVDRKVRDASKYSE